MNAVGVKRLMIGLAVLIAVACAGLVVLRKPALEAGMEWWLADVGIPVAGFSVDRLDHRILVLRDVAVGPANLLSAGTVEVTYALPALFSGKVQSVRLDNLRIAVDLQRDPRLIEEATALYRRVEARLATGPAAAGPAIPPVFIGDGALSLASAAGSADVTFAARLQPQDDGPLTLSADLIAGRLDSPEATLEAITGPISATITAGDRIALTADLSMTATTGGAKKRGPFVLETRIEAGFDAVTGDGLDLSLALLSADAGVEISAGTRLAHVLERPEGSLTLSGSIDANGAAWRAFGGPEDASGTIAAEFAGTVSLDPRTRDSSPPGAAPAVLVTGKGALEADALVLPNLGRADRGSIAVDVTATESSVEIQTLAGSSLAVSPDDRWRKGLPDAVADILSDALFVDLSQTAVTAIRPEAGDSTGHWRAEMQPRIAIRSQDGARLSLQSRAEMDIAVDLRPSSTEGDANLKLENFSLALPGMQIGDVGADLALGFKTGPAALDLRLLQPGTLTVGALSTTSVRAQNPVEFVLTSGALKTADLDTPDPKLSGSLDLQPKDPIRAVVDLDGDPDRAVDARLGRVRLAGTGLAGACPAGTVTIDTATLTLNDDAVELQDNRITVSQACPGGGLIATTVVGAIRQIADAPLLAPVTARADLTGSKDGFTVDGAVALLDGTEVFVVSGAAAADGSTGEIAIARTAPLTFSANGPSPADFSAAFGALKRVRGKIDGTARYRWSDETASSTARLDLRDLSFDVGAVAVRDLDLGLTLQPVWPPETPAGQALSIGRIDVGTAFEEAALEELEMRYALIATVPTTLRINGLNGQVLGGTFRLEPFTLDPTQPGTETVLHVAGLDMSKLAALTKMEKLKATGRLGGRIPIVLGDGTLAIRGGRLDAAGPGRLSYSSAQAAALLRGQGEEVDMMLKALQDFRYESLGLDLDKTAGNDLSVKLSLLGNNPEVLDGYPFRINLNLTSQITPVLDALATLYGMSRDTLERVWTTR